MLAIFNIFLNFRFLELTAQINYLKYLTWRLKKFQEVLSTNPWIIDSKNFTGPDPPEWRKYTSVAYFKDKLYYLGGLESETGKNNRVDVRRSNEKPMK